MADVDKVVAYTEKGGEGTIHFAEWRVDYDDPRDYREIAGLDDDADLEAHLGGRAHQPPGDYPGHEPKAGHQRKIVVENAAARDQVIDDLDADGVTHTAPEDVSPTSEEEDAIESYGAYNGVLAADAMKFLRAVNDLDAGNISQKDLELGRNPHRGEDVPKGPPSVPSGLQ